MTAQFEKNTQTELTYIKHFSNKIELFLDTNFLLSFHLIDYKQPNILVQKQEPHEHETMTDMRKLKPQLLPLLIIKHYHKS